MLGNVLMLCTFVFFIFGVVAVQLWAGVLRQRCFLNITNSTSASAALEDDTLQLDTYYGQYNDEAVICTLEGDQGLFRCASGFLDTYRVGDTKCEGSIDLFERSGGGDMHDKDKLYRSANGTDECVNWNQYYSNCAPGPENPFKGAISFDNIGYAWIAIFQVISLEGWVDIMYYVMDAHSFFSFIYFILLIVIGSFFMINLWRVFNLISV